MDGPPARHDEPAAAPWPSPRWRYAIGALTALVVLVGLARAWQLRWVCDDAFVSFRYADHLVQGHGLVWNVGERVEGYTNLLWTLLLAAGSAAKLDPVSLSQLLGWLSFAGVVLASWRLGAQWSRPQPHVPVAVWVLVLMEDALIWTTGGLETMTVAALCMGMALALFGVERAGARREWAAGAIAALLALTRADGALLGGTLALGYLYVRYRRPSRAVLPTLRTLGPLLVAVAGNLVFRLSYYGEWLPNTYYAKSAGSAWFDQGLVYVGLMLARNHVLLWMALIAFGMEFIERRAARSGRPWGGAIFDRAAAVLAGTALVFVLYVAYSGGDFMFARRLVPLLPLVLVAFERLLRRLGSLRWQLALGGLLGLAAALPYPLYERHAEHWRLRNVADERRVYPASLRAYRRAQGEALGRAFSGIDAQFLLEGGLCMLAYYSGLPRFMELNGLTDPVIAKQKLRRRGMPGHEKAAPFWWLDINRVPFMVLQSPPPDPAEVNVVAIGGERLHLLILYWDEAIMDALRHRPGVRFLPLPEQLDGIEQRMQQADCAEATRLFYLIDHYYLRWHGRDTGERAHLMQLREQRCPEPSSRP